MSDAIEYLDAAIPFGWCSTEKTKHEDCPIETTTIWFGKHWRCPCPCHPKRSMDERIALLAKQLGVTLPPQSDYALTPPPAARTPPLLNRSPDDMGQLEVPGALPLFPPDIDVQFAPTQTGRLARGELEYRVKQACDRYVAGALSDNHGGLTPSTIADFIDPESPPSVGAIGAVFDRWKDIGIARIERSPLRFVTYSDDALRYGLAFMKQRSKQLKKTQHAGWAQPARS